MTNHDLRIARELALVLTIFMALATAGGEGKAHLVILGCAFITAMVGVVVDWFSP